MRCWLRTTSWKPSVVSSFGEPDADHRAAGAQQLEAEPRAWPRRRPRRAPGRARPVVPPSSAPQRRARARAALVVRLDHGDVRDARPAARPAASPARSCPRRSRPRARRRAAPAARRGRRWPAAPSARRRATETPSGSTRASAARTFTKSANAPGTCTPTSTRSRHRFVSPARHSRHSPQPRQRVHRDPRAVAAPPRPRRSATTVPANSCPITSGGVRLPMWPR